MKKKTQIHQVLQFFFMSFYILKLLYDSLIINAITNYTSFKFEFNKIFMGFFFLFERA